ncbi:hypothetical protein [Nocardia arthritidis]|uniref:Uncharacterized protein n=1 Tax=Nocardia arthritidis TaxID=228602 RepID=A0A6G9YG60_9NOCA|nr:hypothetical protein [Nocardia arthritidis]QIS12178.1 hypothetical protein F5544_21575 [Nocardia arthritidis]
MGIVGTATRHPLRGRTNPAIPGSSSVIVTAHSVTITAVATDSAREFGAAQRIR